ncbi:MAG: hypothetical protein Q7T05_06065 [Dehalococcoidia bacterium]|nr:hypothetical protein [Dehalococcoidia bacterium]
MGEALTRSLGLLTSLDPRTLLLLIVVCAVGEFAVGIPYVLESIWLLMGYYLGTHALSFSTLLVLWVAAQFGRQAGSMGLYYTARVGTYPLARLYRKLRISRFIPRAVQNSKVLDRMSRPSPFSIAVSRLMGLRVPMALMSAARHDVKSLMLGVLLSSIVWDTVYIVVGLTVGAKAGLKPVEMLLVSLGGLTVLYAVLFGIRRLTKSVRVSKRAVIDPPGKPE